LPPSAPPPSRGATPRACPSAPPWRAPQPVLPGRRPPPARAVDHACERLLSPALPTVYAGRPRAVFPRSTVEPVQRRAHVVVHGRVQGVSFRAELRDRARSRGLAGWVAKRADDAVEVAWGDPQGESGFTVRQEPFAGRR